VGGGFILVPLQVLFARVGQHKANGTSLLGIIPGSLVALLIYYFGAPQPQVDLRFAGLLIIGSVFGTYVGARSMNRIPERALKYVLTVVLIGIGAREVLVP
jgi:uncharacterized membrane protein YfcA